MAITQRLAETSVKVTERLRLISGLQIGFNSLNRVRAQINPELKDVVQKLPKRTFLYLNDKDNPIFQIPQYSYKGKLTQLKPQPQLPLKPQKQDFIVRILKFVLGADKNKQPQQDQEESEDQHDDLDQSVYYPDDKTQSEEDDMEEDEAFLNEDDMGW